MAAGHRIPSQRSVTSTAPGFAFFLADFDLGVFVDAFDCVSDLVTPCDLAFFDNAYILHRIQIKMHFALRNLRLYYVCLLLNNA